MGLIYRREGRGESTHRAKKRWVNVVMKLISIKRPITASMAASAAKGSPILCKGWKKPRPWKLLTLRISASYHGNGPSEELGKPNGAQPVVACMYSNVKPASTAR